MMKALFVLLCAACLALVFCGVHWSHPTLFKPFAYMKNEEQRDSENRGDCLLSRDPGDPENQVRTRIHGNAEVLDMSYRPPPRSGITTRGVPMDVSQSMARRLGMPPTEFKVLTPESVKDFVFVTACSANHFNESRDAVASVQRHYPGRRLLYYDIGLNDEQRRQVASWCDVTLRRFDFDRYHDHIKGLRGKHFKPVVVMEALFQYGGVVWMDASIRFKGGEIPKAYPRLVQNGGFYTFLNSNFWTYVFLHPNTSARLTTDLERQKTSKNIISSVFVMHKTKEVYWNIAHWWFLCALDPACVPPSPQFTRTVDCKDHQKYNLPGGATGRGSCHSYDQASLNVLASNYYGFQKHEYNPEGRAVDMMRYVTNIYTIREC